MLTPTVIASIIIFALTFFAIFSGILHRAIASIAGAISMVMLGEFMGFYGQETAIEAINFNTLELLIGMMIIVGLLQRTGYFEYLSILIAKRAGNNQFSLFLALCGLTALASAILDNVTTIVLVAPMTLAIADVIDVSPTPYLIGEAITSIVGGMATLVGDPPNIIIGSAAGLSFNNFLVHLGPASLLIWTCTALTFWFIFQFSSVSDKKIEGLREMDATRSLKDLPAAKKLLAIIGIVVVLYATHSYLNIEAGLVALVGASLALVWIQPNIKEALESIEWDAIVFITGLFVVVGGMEASGVLNQAAHWLGLALEHHPVVAPIGLLWIAGILSAVIDNIPFTVAMVPILLELGAGMGGNYLWWGLAMGAALGGAASPVGSSSNVVAMSVSERSAEAITARDWVKVGVPVALVNLTIASLFLLLISWTGY